MVLWPPHPRPHSDFKLSFFFSFFFLRQCASEGGAQEEGNLIYSVASPSSQRLVNNGTNTSLQSLRSVTSYSPWSSVGHVVYGLTLIVPFSHAFLISQREGRKKKKQIGCQRSIIQDVFTERIKLNENKNSFFLFFCYLLFFCQSLNCSTTENWFAVMRHKAQPNKSISWLTVSELANSKSFSTSAATLD